MEELFDFIERQANLWADLETIKEECLSEDETLEEWLQFELLEVVRLFKKGE